MPTGIDDGGHDDLEQGGEAGDVRPLLSSVVACHTEHGSPGEGGSACARPLPAMTTSGAAAATVTRRIGKTVLMIDSLPGGTTAARTLDGSWCRTNLLAPDTDFSAARRQCGAPVDPA